MLQIIILQTSLYVCFIDTPNDMFVKSIIMNHLPVWQVIPENPGEQLHSKPPSSVLVQVPLLWQGFGEHTSKYVKYHSC